MNTNQTILSTLLLTARPAAGKSEIIKYLKELQPGIRKKEFHIGKIKVIDDFPFLWRWFEEDHLLAKMHKKRLFTDEKGYFKYVHQWDLLIELINLEYMKFIRDTEAINDYTVIIEFSRGKEHGGYNRAIPLLNDSILKKLSILYVNVSWEESLRKNRKRFNPDRPDSILEHGLPDEKLNHMYSECDFKELSQASSESILINKCDIPYTIFENEDDVTTEYKLELGLRLKDCLDILWKKKRN
jgi:hypothetical protein